MAGKRGLSAEQIPVLVVRDRSGQTADFKLEKLDTAHVTAVLRPLIDPEAILCSLLIRFIDNYKMPLSNVERAFRSLKTIDLKVRPIHHRLADRVRAHIFLCMLAYYVEWHMREAWRELMFADTDQGTKATRDPVAPAKRSKAALAKAARHVLDDGTPVHGFSTLLSELSTVVRSTCRTPNAGAGAPTFAVITTANPYQPKNLSCPPVN